MARFHEAIARQLSERRDEVPESPDSPQLAELIEKLRDTVTPAQVSLAAAFTRQLFGNDEPSAVEASEPNSLLGVTSNAFRFVLHRDRDALAVRVYRPQMLQHGWDSPHVVVEALLEDHPFIVDTVCETVRQQGGEVRLLLHPLLGTQRSSDGTLERVGPPRSLGGRESYLHVLAANLEPTADLQRILADRLGQLHHVAADFDSMQRRLAETADDLRSSTLPAAWAEDAGEVADLIDWLADGNFIYLGYREYDFVAAGPERCAVVRQGSGLGLLRDDARSRYHAPAALAAVIDRRLQDPPPLIVSKTNATSPVHHLEPMDDIFLPQVDTEGRTIGGRRLLGLFTSKADATAASKVPLLRHRLATILDLDHVVAGSHDHKELVALYDSVSKNELLASRPADVRQLLQTVAKDQPGSAIRLCSHADAWQRGLFVVAIIPRSRFSTELHRRVAAVICEELQGRRLHEHLALDERSQVRLHLYLTLSPEILRNPPIAAAQQRLDDLLSNWDDDLFIALGKLHPAGVAKQIASKYGAIFSPAYKAEMSTAQAVQDIHCLEALNESGTAQVELAERSTPSAIPGRMTALRIYSTVEALVLSDFIPVLENLGLRVFGEDMVRLTLPDAGEVLIRILFVQAALDPNLDVAGTADLLIPTLQAVRSGMTESDRLNTLVLHVGLDQRAVALLRTYVGHAVQAGVASRETLVDALTDHPECAAKLFRLFASRFDPDASALSPGERDLGPAREAQESFLASLDSVASLVHDGILRTLGATVSATVRTNFYDPNQALGAAIVIKLAASRLAHLPEPRPMFETYVHAPHVEGVHLRAGRVARGGLRLSDRPDDFRAEILGLMKTQVVKNAVIVPVGAKGGFVIKRKSKGQPQTATTPEQAYRTFVGALLSLADNIEDEQIVPPSGTLIYDDSDPYLVVAADKGTATFSDIANEIADEYGYWLGDAFASGGRHGYDHKVLGITARGAWECAGQHFRELGRDIHNEPLTVIGVGDMHGDVFGNGMLRSRSICLLAAFDHRHIFLDPDPDAERSFLERQRLFQLPTSSWADYDTSALSTGGAVYSRSAKTLSLSAEVLAMLDAGSTSFSGEALIRAILRMPADLLWNGGVGTYVKASDETNNDVADTANDRVRVDADALRVLVVAEGGNQGFSQRARVEFALAGGRIHTDAIDNSGGVDCSDYEVNLKIALHPAVRSGRVTSEQRNAILRDLADEVTERVLHHNRRQAAALALDQNRSRTQLASFRDLMTGLEAEAGLDRQLHELPTREALRERRSVFLGLTRPELAVLLAYAKIDLQRCVLDSPLCDDPAVRPYLDGYFPAAIHQYASATDHPLRREITALELANQLVDVMGIVFPRRLAADTGHELALVVGAWTAAMAILEGTEVLRRIGDETGSLPVGATEQCSFAFAQAVERATRWIIETQDPGEALSTIIERFHDPVQELIVGWPDRMTEELVARYRDDVQRLTDTGVGEALAERLATLASAEDTLEISHIADAGTTPLPMVAATYFLATSLVDLDWIRRTLPATVAGEDRWERRAIGGLLEGLMYARRQITISVLGCQKGEPSTEACLERYDEIHHTQLQRLTQLIDDLKTSQQPSLSALLVAMRELGRLARA